MDALHSVSPLLCGLAMRKAEHAEDRALEQVGEAEARAEGHRQHRHRRRDRQQRGSAHALADGAAPGEDATDAHEIGRAPCRERGCQYVKISWGGVTLKK